MIRRLLLPFITLLTLAACTFAGTLDLEKASAIPKQLQRLVDEGSMAGAVAYVEAGGVKAQFAIGKRDLKSGDAMPENALFWVASMTKPLAGVCIGMLVDEGKLDWNDPIEKHLPEFQSLRDQPPGARLRTVRDLLMHTSGLGDAKATKKDATLAELTAAYAATKPLFTPGEKWSYCNSGINTLGRIVEVISGMSFADFLQKRLCDPLGMTDTTFWPNAEQAKRLATSYAMEDGKLVEVPVFFIQGNLDDRTRTAFPAGGLFSTAADMAAVYRMLQAGGTVNGKTYLKKETLSEMTRTQSGDIKTGFVPGMSWGYGFQVVKTPEGVTTGLSSGTYGHGGAYGTQSWGDPKTAIYILLFQRAKLPNGDASEMRRIFNETASAAIVP